MQLAASSPLREKQSVLLPKASASSCPRRVRMALLPDFRGRAVDALEYGVEVEVGRGFGVDRMAGVLRRAVVEIAADQVEVARRALSGGKRRRPEKG